MVVVTKLDGVAQLPYHQDPDQVLEAAREQSRSRLHAERLRGLRGFDTSSIPNWVWWGGGGLLAGALVGTLLFRK